MTRLPYLPTATFPQHIPFRMIGRLASGLLILLTGCSGTRTPQQSNSTGVRRIISSEQAPTAIGPYSQAIQVGDVLYFSGQIGINPTTGSLAPGGIRAETRQVLDNLQAVAEAAGFSLSDAVQVQIFLADMAEYAAMNEEYASYFGTQPPARATVQVAALPRGARVEIMAIAAR